MEKVAEKRDKEMRPGFVLSIVLHVLFVAIFLLPLLPAPPQAKSEDSVNVELVPQQEEKQEVATKANEKPDRPPKPTQKPDDKPAQQTAENKDEPQQPKGKKSDEQPPKQSDSKGKEAAEKPAAKSAEAKADKPDEQAEKPAPKADDASADKPVEKAGQQPSATETPPNATEKPVEPKPSSSDTKQTATTSAVISANPKDEKSGKEASSPSNAMVENPTLSPKINDSQSLKESQTSATAGDKESQVVEQATQNPTSLEPEDSQPTTADSNSQLRNFRPSKQGELEELGMSSLNSDQPSQSPPISTPQVLATDSSSDTKVNPSDELQSSKDAASVTVPGVMTSGQPKTGEAENSPGNSVAEGGAGLVVEPTQQRGQATPSKPTEGEQKARAATSPKAGFAASAGPFVQAKRLYSADELSRLPKGFLAQWKQLSAQMRISQLCNFEGAAQLNAAGLHILRFGLPHSSESRSASRSIETDKAVYRTSDGYHYVGVKCNVDSSAMKVISFAYRLGASIPQDQWKNLNLPTN